MRLTEAQAKRVLAEAGLPVPDFIVVDSPEAAAEAVRARPGPAVLKVQIPRGGRGKAGGVQIASSPEEALSIARDMLGATLLGHPVNSLLVEPKVEIGHEAFLAFTYDTSLRRAVALAGPGGVDVESVSEQLARLPFSVRAGLSPAAARQLARALRPAKPDRSPDPSILQILASLFLRLDALLLEINPLALDERGQWHVLDVHLELDDDAAFRHPEFQFSAGRFDPAGDSFEQRAAAIDAADHRGVAGRLVPFDGDLGLLIGGGGASLTLFDAVLDQGLRPANYCEIGGNPSVWKVAELTKLILSQPRVTRLAVMMNVVSNTRADLVARGVIKGVLEMGLDPSQTVVAFRIPGSYENEARRLLEHYGISPLGREVSLDEAVAAIKR